MYIPCLKTKHFKTFILASNILTAFLVYTIFYCYSNISKKDCFVPIARNPPRDNLLDFIGKDEYILRLLCMDQLVKSELQGGRRMMDERDEGDNNIYLKARKASNSKEKLNKMVNQGQVDNLNEVEKQVGQIQRILKTLNGRVAAPPYEQNSNDRFIHNSTESMAVVNMSNIKASSKIGVNLALKNEDSMHRLSQEAFKGTYYTFHFSLHLNSRKNLKTSIRDQEGEGEMPYIIGITPTYYRLTQKADLTTLCQTLMNVPRFLWIVIEDSNTTSQRVRGVLTHCKVESVLLNIPTSNESKSVLQKGVDQRNAALDWIRMECDKCQGVVYFMDDDNKYDLRLFERIRKTKGVSVFPVAFVAGLKYEGPICKNGTVVKWHVQYAPKRHIPIDMAGFAVNVRMIINKSDVRIGYKKNGVKRSSAGYIEPDFLQSIGANRSMVECIGITDEVLVWHVSTHYGKVAHEKKDHDDPDFNV